MGDCLNSMIVSLKCFCKKLLPVSGCTGADNVNFYSFFQVFITHPYEGILNNLKRFTPVS